MFVYNAENDAWSKSMDFAHKILRPSTYPCDLCALTHGTFGERKAWSEFRAQSGVAMEFIYLKKFKEQFGELTNQAPLVLMNKGKGWTIVMERKDFQAVGSLDNLISHLTRLTSEPQISSEEI
jgi:hypothetical protein